MRLLIDANLSPRIALLLTEAGYDAVHVFGLGMHTASDDEIVQHAFDDNRVIVSMDTDFGAILARLNRAKPSFVLLRHVSEMTPDEQAGLLRANLDALTADFAAGAVASFARGTIRVRRLPFSTE